MTADQMGRAVMVVRQHLINNGCTVPIDVIWEALEAAEAAWPHGAPSDAPAPVSARSAPWDSSWGARSHAGALGAPPDLTEGPAI